MEPKEKSSNRGGLYEGSGKSVLDQVRSVEENIGIRKSSRFIPIIVTLLTILFFIAAIQNKGESDLEGKPIEIGAVEIPAREESDWIALTPLMLMSQNARIRPDSIIVGGTVIGGIARYVPGEKNILYIKYVKPENPGGQGSPAQNEMVRLTYQFKADKDSPGLGTGHWEAHRKIWRSFRDFRQAVRRSDELWNTNLYQFVWGEGYKKSEVETPTREVDPESNVAYKIWQTAIAYLQPLARVLAFDLPRVMAFLFKLGWVIAFYAVFPGLAGMFYRRNFFRYFIVAAAILLFIEITFQIPGWGSVAQDKKEGLINPYSFYQVPLAFLLGVFLLIRIRIYNPFQGPFSGLKAVFARDPENVGNKVTGKPGKNIVICLDGSWNTPGQLEHGQLASTNVFKLFRMLKGSRLPVKKLNRKYNANIAKFYENKEDPDHSQIGLYYNGVGNKLENSGFGQLFGGAFGMGAESIKERAYMDIVNEYNPGDRIFIFGFSRGAAIARLVAGVIGRRGIPRTVVTLRLFGQMRPIMRLFGRYDDVKVNVLGCWDTVGAFGLAKNIMGIPFQKMNLLKDLTVGDHVERAYHLVALDERRDSFEPTLMDADPTQPGRIVEVWFSGAHSNVGGGYVNDKLSNGALSFMLEHVSSGYRQAKNVDATGQPCEMGDESWGIYLNATNALEKDDDTGEDYQKIYPDPLGRVRASGGAVYKLMPRDVPANAVIHDSVFQLMEHRDAKYAPESLFKLSEKIASQKGLIEEKLKSLTTIHSIDDAQEKKVREWLDSRMTIRKWGSVQDESDGKFDFTGKLVNSPGSSGSVVS